jgi:hypothetical protein
LGVDLLREVQPPNAPGWRALFDLDLSPGPGEQTVEDRFTELAYQLGLVVPFDWPAWFSPDRYPGGRGLEAAPVADAVRLITAYVRGDRFSSGSLNAGLRDGTLRAAVARLWACYVMDVSSNGRTVDWAGYSDDGVYRWYFERRWRPGPSLCWVGLNPGTGDTDGKPRPTLAKVIGWAQREGCGSAIVVNLFSFRSTDPKRVVAAGDDAIGDRTDEVIRDATARA